MINFAPGPRANDTRVDRLEGSVRSVLEVTLRLLAYCRASDWAGHDPYDALNSQLFKTLPFLDTRLFRLVLTQAMKRSPLDLRPLLGVDKTQNSKGLALFLTAILKLRKLGLLKDNNLSQALVAQIIALRSPDTEYWSWGYSFPWQTRTMLVPRGAPNLVCTIFVANALLDAFEALGDTRCLEMALSAGDYLVKKLYYTEGDTLASFCYPLPTSKAKVHNANFLAAAFLSRLYCETGDERWIGPALQVTRYSAGKQKSDGSWSYGELPNQDWIDNFHTGYNLTSLRAIGRNLRTSEFEPHVRLGFEFYRKYFFRKDGAVRYFHNRTYPVDIHCVAQSILTLLEFQDLDSTSIQLVRLVYDWAMKHMWDKSGFFYFRVLRTVTIRTPYMRWSQAWMLLALTALFEVVEQLEVPRA
jgi:hypothetical protein